MNGGLVKDKDVLDRLIEERKRLGLDIYDEVWEGWYVMPSTPKLNHQKLVHRLSTFLAIVTEDVGMGEVFPGANVSDRKKGWKDNYRIPDIVVVLNESRATS